MSGICGWFGRPAAAEDSTTLRRMAESVVRSDGAAAPPIFASRAAVAAAGRRPQLVEADEAVLAIEGRPFREAGDGNDREGFARRLIAGLRKQGPQCLEGLNGDFAIAFFDQRKAEGLLAIDGIGMRSLVFAEQDGRLVFGSTLDALVAHPGFAPEIDAQALYDYVFYHVVPGPRTIFRHARRLQPGHYLRFDGRSRGEPRPFWQMRFREDRQASLPELKAQFFEALSGSVADQAGEARCGAFLSGGTDSSTVSGMLGRVKKAPAQTFSIGFHAAGFDEMEYARIAARHFSTQQHEYYVTPDDVVNAAPRIADTYDQPFGNASAVPAYYCARLAREQGIERLLAGDGGDELFGGNDRYAKQKLFALYEKVPRVLGAGLLEPLLLRPDFTRRMPLLRKGRRYLEQATMPMPRRYEAGNLIEHIGRETIFEPDFLAQINADSPHELMQQAHAPFAGCSVINQMLGIDLRFILADGDLPKVTRMCGLAGVDVGFPLLDRRLVDFSAQLAPELKLRGLQLRWFFKDALRDFLPHEIIVKKKHGFGLPVGVWLGSHRPLSELARDTLDRLKRRGIVRPAFVDDLTGRLLNEHPGYFGSMVWVLMMLGLWMDSRKL